MPDRTVGKVDAEIDLQHFGGVEADHRIALANLYLAGDYVQNVTEVTSMEAAVRTGLMAAEAVRHDHAPTTPEVHIDPPTRVPDDVQRLIDVVLPQDPIEARVKCLAWLQSLFATRA